MNELRELILTRMGENETIIKQLREDLATRDQKVAELEEKCEKKQVEEVEEVEDEEKNKTRHWWMMWG